MLSGKPVSAPRHALALLAFLALSWGFFAPPGHWGRSVYFGHGQDPVAFAWFLNWWPFALSHHLNPVYTWYADWPAGEDLSWKTSIPALGLLMAPFTQAFGAIPVFNVLMLASPALSAFAVYLAAAELTGDFAAAIIAGLLFGISGYEIGQDQLHLNLAFIPALPLCIWACLRAARQGWVWWRLGLVLGLLLAFEFGTSQEVFASFVLFAAIAVAALWQLNPETRLVLHRLAPGIAAGLGLSLLLVSPFVAQMLRGYSQARGAISHPDDYGNNLLAFIIPTPLSFFGGQLCVPITKYFVGNYTEQGGYFSAPLLLLLGYIVYRGAGVERALGAVLLAALLASMGPYMHVMRFHISTAPWLFAYKLPLLSAILPGRLALYGWLAACLLLARWLAQRGDWRRLGLAGLCLLALAPAQSFARNWRTLNLPPVFATLPVSAHVLVLPEFGQEMAWQVLSGMRFYAVGQGYLGTGRPAPFSHWRLFEPLWEGHFSQIGPREFAAYLAAYRVQYVVVLPNGYNFYQESAKVDELAAAAAARALLGAAGWTTRNGTLFTPAAPPPGAAEIAAYAAYKPDPAALLPPDLRARDVKHEIRRVCEIRALSAALRLNPAPLLGFYAAHIHPVLPPASIACGAKP